MKFNKKKLPIIQIINKFGESKARMLLRNHFSKPENFYQFKMIFRKHLTSRPPEFHEEMISNVIEKGIQTRAFTSFAFGAPRGTAKSTQFDVFFLIWAVLNGHFHYAILISDTYDQAKLLLSALKDEIEHNVILRFIYGNCVGKIWGEETIVLNTPHGEAMIQPLGAGMKVRGRRFNQYRPDLVIIDDLENLEGVYSEERRNKLERWFDYDLPMAMNKSNGLIIMLGTILHKSSLLSKILDGQGRYKSWFRRCYKIIEEGKSIWEERFPLSYLYEIRDNPDHPDYIGSTIFEQEMMNDPQDDSFYIIKSSWIQTYDRDARIRTSSKEDFMSQFSGVYMGVDPAISEKDTADNFSIYVFGISKMDSKEYQLDSATFKSEDINEQVRMVCDLCELWRVDSVGIETVAFQKGLSSLVKQELNKRGLSTRVVEIKTDKDKVRRARIHSSAFEGGFIVLDSSHSDHANIKREIASFPLEKHDDRFDALMLARETRGEGRVGRVFARKPSGF